MTSMAVLAYSHRKAQHKTQFAFMAVDNHAEFATDFLPAAGVMKLR